MAMAVTPVAEIVVCQVSPASLLLKTSDLPPAYTIEGEEEETARARIPVLFVWGRTGRDQLLPPSTLLKTPPRSVPPYTTPA